MNQQDFGLRLKELRLSYALTQSQLAEKIGVSRQAYINYEAGRCIPSAEIISNLSKLFGIDFMEIIFTHNSYNENKKLLSNFNRDELFLILNLYSKLSYTSRKRIITLMTLMTRGGDV